MAAVSQAAIISASSATSRARRRTISWSSTCRLSHTGGGDSNPPPGERWVIDGVLQIEGTSPGHAEAGASARSGGLTFRLIIGIETASLFVAGLLFSALIPSADIVIGSLRADPDCLPAPVPRCHFLLVHGQAEECAR